MQKGVDELAARHPLIQRYGQQKRVVSPNRHLAIAGALNDFSQTVVWQVLEKEYMGRVVYAGGDDVLAILPVADLLSACGGYSMPIPATTPNTKAASGRD